MTHNESESFLVNMTGQCKGLPEQSAFACNSQRVVTGHVFALHIIIYHLQDLHCIGANRDPYPAARSAVKRTSPPCMGFGLVPIIFVEGLFFSSFQVLRWRRHRRCDEARPWTVCHRQGRVMRYRACVPAQCACVLVSHRCQSVLWLC